MLPMLSMCSQCAQWVFGPLSPVPPVCELESDDVVTIPAQEVSADVIYSRDDEITNIAPTSDASTDNKGEGALEMWLLSFPGSDTEEDSKGLYSAVQLNPVHAGLDPVSLFESDSASLNLGSDECDKSDDLSVPTSLGLREADFFEAEESDYFAKPTLSIISSAISIVTPRPQDAQFSPLPVSSLLSSPLLAPVYHPPSSSSLTYIYRTPSTSLSSFPSSLCSLPISISSRTQVPVSRPVSVIFLFEIASDILFLSSLPAEIPYDSGATYTNHLDLVQLSPIVRPPEDPPPDVSNELNDWLHAHTILGIEECPLLPSSNPPALPGEFCDTPVYSTLVDDLGVGAICSSSVSEDLEFYSLESRPALQTSQMTSLPHSRGPTPELDLRFDKSQATFQVSHTTSTTSS